MKRSKTMADMDSWDIFLSGFPKIRDSVGNDYGRFYRGCYNYFEPATIRSDAEILAEAFERMAEHLRSNVAEGADVDIRELMRAHDLDPAIQSDRVNTRKFLREAGLLEKIEAQPARYVRRLTNGTGSSAGSSATDPADQA